LNTENNILTGFLIITLGIPSFTLGMKISGMADSGNPLWNFLSTVTAIELGILALVLVLWFAGVFSPSKEESSAAKPKPKPESTAEELKQMELDREEQARRRTEQEEAERKRAEAREQQRLAEEAAKQEERRLWLDLKRTRSFDAALEAALEDF
jgi:hypothetical protein